MEESHSREVPASRFLDVHGDRDLQCHCQPSDGAQVDGILLPAQEPIEEGAAGTHSYGDAVQAEPFDFHGVTHALRQLSFELTRVLLDLAIRGFRRRHVQN